MSKVRNGNEGDEAVFRALYDARRREILDLLKNRPRTTGEICSHFGEIDRCTVIMHIDILRKADLVVSRKEGRIVWNYLDALPIKRIHDRWIGQYANYAVEMLERLKAGIENDGSGDGNNSSLGGMDRD
ncbi:MAG: helix-turn-helix domain-containing protein [Thermoplasmatales archaeon]|nr:helix-turn-helix domain-containing protein [Thermoplasmatales archaeon]